jgi:rare lipoprotein A
MFKTLGLLATLCLGIFTGCASKDSIKPVEMQTNSLKAANKESYNKPYIIKQKTYVPLDSAKGYRQQGVASWYGTESGRRTSNGTRFKRTSLSAAHKTLPIPSTVRVTNLSNGRQVDVLINDRGPFIDKRLIDLSPLAAKQLRISGLAEVEVEYLEN